ncbi:hypothetical protein C8R47DRAFT_1245370 [Mycena vitilis]|nr:hypothetical protein C8R47DRAFT_1245370 [Mycena vitilis]
MAPIIFAVPTSRLSVGISVTNEPTITTTDATHAVDYERSIDSTGLQFRYVPRCNEDEDDNCPPRSSSSSRSSSTSAPPGPTNSGNLAAAHDSHSAVAMVSLATVLGIVLFSIAAFLVWRRLRLHSTSVPGGYSRAGRPLRTRSPVTIRENRHVRDTPPAVPAREVQDPPRRPLEAPPPAYTK